MPTYAMPNLTSYCRDSPLLLVHPVLQHLLDFLSRRLVLLFFLLCVFDREPGVPVLCGGTVVFLIIYHRWNGDRNVRGTIDTIGIGGKRSHSVRVKRVRFCFK